MQQYASYGYPGMPMYNAAGAGAGGFAPIGGQYTAGTADLIALNEQLVAAAAAGPGQFTLTQEQIAAYSQQYGLMMPLQGLGMPVQQGAVDMSLSQLQAQYLSGSQMMMGSQVSITEGITGNSPAFIESTSQIPSFQSIPYVQTMQFARMGENFTTESTAELASMQSDTAQEQSVTSNATDDTAVRAKDTAEKADGGLAADHTASAAASADKPESSQASSSETPSVAQEDIPVDEPKDKMVVSADSSSSSPAGPSAEAIPTAETPRRESSRGDTSFAYLLNLL